MFAQFLLSSLAVLASIAVPTDCLVSGPHGGEGASAEAPTIDDGGTTIGTNGSGCDGCTINVKLTITWHHTGAGTYTVGGTTVTEEVAPGKVTQVSSTIKMECGTSSGGIVAAAVDVENGESDKTWNCEACQ